MMIPSTMVHTMMLILKLKPLFLLIILKGSAALDGRVRPLDAQIEQTESAQMKLHTQLMANRFITTHIDAFKTQSNVYSVF